MTMTVKELLEQFQLRLAQYHNCSGTLLESARVLYCTADDLRREGRLPERAVLAVLDRARARLHQYEELYWESGH
jgi:hypothetical protein